MKKIIIILFMTCISMLLAADEGFFTSYSEMIAGDFVFHEDGNGQFVNNEGVVQDFLFSWSIDDGLIFFQIEKPWFEDIYRKQVKKILLLAGRESSGRNFAFGFYNELNAQKWPSMLFSDVPREFEGSGRIYKDPSSHLVEGTREYSVDNLDNPYPGTPWVEAAQGHGIGEGFTIENSWGTVYTRLLIMNGYISFDKPCVERMIGTLQTECLDYLIGPMSVSELQAEIDSWLKKYHSYRPHESLGFLTPHEFLNNFMSHSSTAVSLS